LDIERNRENEFTSDELNIHVTRSTQIKQHAKLERAGVCCRSLLLAPTDDCIRADARARGRDGKAVAPCFWITQNRKIDRFPSIAARQISLSRRQHYLAGWPLRRVDKLIDSDRFT
jgi:hypothetical protein